MSNDVNISIPISTVGPLDTTNPPTDRPAGTLIEAINLGSRWWGPRIPNRADSWYGQFETDGSEQAQFMEYDGTSSQSIGRTMAEGIKNLGTSWTLDVWCGLKDAAADLAYANAYPKIPVFAWATTPLIYVWITSPMSASGGDPLGTIHVQVKTTDNAGSVLHTYELQSNVVMPVNTGGWSSNFDKIRHIRVVRSGSSLAMYVDGVVADSDTVAADEAHYVAASMPATWLMGTFTGGSGYFKGIIPCVSLRDGAHTTTFDSGLQPQNPWAKDCRLHIGCVYSGRSGDVLIDASRSRMHGRHFPTTAAANQCVIPSGAPIQGIGNFVNRSGKPVTAVMVGGKLVMGYV